MSDRDAVPPHRDRFLIGIVVGAVFLILFGVGAVLLMGRIPRAATADLGSPEGVVQAYVEAVRAGEPDRAYELLSRAAQASLPRQDYRQRFPRGQPSNRGESRVLIETKRAEADTAEVTVTVSRFTARSEPFSAGSSHRDVTVRLVREDGAWRIQQPPEPYSLAW